MKARTLSFWVVTLVLFSVASAVAGPMTYNITVNTSSISGIYGSLDFQFNPGPLVSQPASVQILNFSSDGTLAGTPLVTGDVVGGLPGTVSLDNVGFYNDYFDGFTFGNTLSFELALSGDALTAPDGLSTSGSAFGFSMFSDPGGTVPVLTGDPSGVALGINVNLSGTTTPISNSSVATISAASAVPEPGSAVLLLAGVVACFTRLRGVLRDTVGANR